MVSVGGEGGVVGAGSSHPAPCASRSTVTLTLEGNPATFITAGQGALLSFETGGSTAPSSCRSASNSPTPTEVDRLRERTCLSTIGILTTPPLASAAACAWQESAGIARGQVVHSRASRRTAISRPAPYLVWQARGLCPKHQPVSRLVGALRCVVLGAKLAIGDEPLGALDLLKVGHKIVP